MAGVEADAQLAAGERAPVRLGVVLAPGLFGASPTEEGAVRIRLRPFRDRAFDHGTATQRKTVVVPGVCPLDVNDLSAEVGEQPRRPGPDRLPGEIEHAQAAERTLWQVRRGAHHTAPAATSASICVSLSPRS